MSPIFFEGEVCVLFYSSEVELMFGFGVWELLLVGGVVLLALFSGRSLATTARQAGRMTAIWLKLKQKLSVLRFLR